MPSDSRNALTMPRNTPALEVVRELRQPLEDLARALGQPPDRISNQALAE
jgi:hypothetical protein